MMNQAPEARPRRSRLRRELVLALLLKLAALFALKLMLLPPRTPPAAAAHGVEARIADPTPVTHTSSKENP